MIINFFSRHKIISIVIVLILVVGVYFSWGGGASEVSYTTAQAEKGALIVSITGSGQVSAIDQIDIKPEVSGKVIWVGVKAGQEVNQWQTLATLDNADTKNAIRDAELDLEQAKIQFEQSQIQAPINYQDKLDALTTAEDSLTQEYEDAFNTLSNIYLDLPAVISALDDILYGDDMDTTISNTSAYENLFAGDSSKYYLIKSFITTAESNYQKARNNYDNNIATFKNLTHYSQAADIEVMLEKTAVTAKEIAQAAKSESNLIDTAIDNITDTRRYAKPLAVLNTYSSSLRSNISKINSHISSLTSQQQALTNAKNQIANAQKNLDFFLIGNPTGNSPIDLRMEENSLKKKELALTELRDQLNSHAIWAPFAGTIAKVNSKAGDSVSTGTVLATLVSKQKIAEITLNEIDVAKIKIGQPATLTFDAVEEATLTGKVFEIDTLGAASQGVVTYGVKIAFDTQDDRIKPGMTTDVAIIVDKKMGVVIIPNAAVQANNNQTFVETLQNGTSQQIPITVGISNDLYTEVVSGLEEGAEVITATIDNSATGATTASTSGNNNRGGGAPDMGFMMMR
ncbi:MAG: efflux RND transporter periplasmic adaptor subunit [Patescibacteria group bacterium]